DLIGLHQPLALTFPRDAVDFPTRPVEHRRSRVATDNYFQPAIAIQVTDGHAAEDRVVVVVAPEDRAVRTESGDLVVEGGNDNIRAAFVLEVAGGNRPIDSVDRRVR